MKLFLGFLSILGLSITITVLQSRSHRFKIMIQAKAKKDHSFITSVYFIDLFSNFKIRVTQQICLVYKPLEMK